MNTSDRFWAKVEKTDGCWSWRGCRNRQGYGLFWYEGRLQVAHRVAWILLRGPIPDGLNVLHRCDTPPCVNAESCLFLGTQRDNMQDKIAKGRRGDSTPKTIRRGDESWSRTHMDRVARGERHWAYGKPGKRGEANGHARITEADVRSLPERHAGGESLQVIADSLGVTKQAVWNALHRKTWKHLQS